MRVSAVTGEAAVEIGLLYDTKGRPLSSQFPVLSGSRRRGKPRLYRRKKPSLAREKMSQGVADIYWEVLDACAGISRHCSTLTRPSLTRRFEPLRFSS